MAKISNLFACLLLCLSAPVASQNGPQSGAHAELSQADIIGRWRTPGRSVPIDEVSLRFAESVGDYGADGSMRAECFVTLSGLVDGAEIPEALTQLRVELTGSWRLEGRTLTHRIARATVTAIRPEMRDFAAMIETMYREIPTVTADIEKWDATTVRMRDKSTGEVFEMVRDGRLN